MIERYTTRRMAELWSPKNRFQKWLDIEILACEAWNKIGVIPDEALEKIKKKANFSIERIEEIEAVVKHEVIAFIQSVSEFVGPEAKYIHMGMTSSDVIDTAFALLLREAADFIIEGIDKLMEAIKQKAFLYKNTPMIGRTHGVHAEPITFGLKMAMWYEEMKRNRIRIGNAKENISYGKISGAVGTYSHLNPFIEEYVCEKLGLKAAPVSNQIIPRDHHAEYFTTLSIIASTLEKFATEIRHLQKTEVLEVEEPFTPGQKGSSAMPHKRNPVASENICGLARLVRAYCIASLENIALWHERDISHSSVERVIAPDATTLLDFMLQRMESIVSGMIVYPERMRENIEKTGGMIFSETLLLRLVEKRITRIEAYEVIQDIAMEAWSKNEEFRSLVKNDERITKYLSDKEIEECFDLNHTLRFTDYIFKRIFEQ